MSTVRYVSYRQIIILWASHIHVWCKFHKNSALCSVGAYSLIIHLCTACLPQDHRLLVLRDGEVCFAAAVVVAVVAVFVIVVVWLSRTRVRGYCLESTKTILHPDN